MVASDPQSEFYPARPRTPGKGAAQCSTDRARPERRRRNGPWARQRRRRSTILRAGGNAADAAVGGGARARGRLPLCRDARRRSLRAGLRSRDRRRLRPQRQRPFAARRHGRALRRRHSCQRPAGGDRAGAASGPRRSRRAPWHARSRRAASRRRCVSPQDGFPVHPPARRGNLPSARRCWRRTRRRARCSCRRDRRSRENETLRQPDLAAILRAVAEDGVERFYRGAIAQRSRRRQRAQRRALRGSGFRRASIAVAGADRGAVLRPRSPDHAAQFLRRDPAVAAAGARGRRDRRDRSRQRRLHPHRLRGAPRRLSPGGAASSPIRASTEAALRRLLDAHRGDSPPGSSAPPRRATAAPPAPSSSTGGHGGLADRERLGAVRRRRRARRHRHPAQQPHGRLRHRCRAAPIASRPQSARRTRWRPASS